MQVTQHLRLILNAFTKSRLRIDLKSLTIRWGTAADAETSAEVVDYDAELEAMTEEERAELAEAQKARWGGAIDAQREVAEQNQGLDL